MTQSNGRHPSPSEPKDSSDGHEKELLSSADVEATKPTAIAGGGEIEDYDKTLTDAISRWPFGMGYGDFCFGRLVDAPLNTSHGLYPIATYEEPFTGSHALPVAEMNSFERYRHETLLFSK